MLHYTVLILQYTARRAFVCKASGEFQSMDSTAALYSDSRYDSSYNDGANLVRGV